MGSPASHSSGRKAAVRSIRRARPIDAAETHSTKQRRAGVGWKAKAAALHDELSIVHAAAVVLQRSLTSDDGDKPAAITQLEGVCYPLADIIGRLDQLTKAVRS